MEDRNMYPDALYPLWQVDCHLREQEVAKQMVQLQFWRLLACSCVLLPIALILYR